MTRGLYKLSFKGTDKVYIGKSLNIEERFKDHLYSLKKGIASKKLQDAYNRYGNPTIKAVPFNGDLEQAEFEAIIKYDTVRNGFNTIYPRKPPIGYEVYPENSRYPKEVYEEILWLLVDTCLHEKNIAEQTGTDVDTVKNLAHLPWINNEYPQLVEDIIYERDAYVPPITRKTDWLSTLY